MSRAHLIHQLNSRRASNNNFGSPHEDEFVTATSNSSFDAGRDAIHSTAQMPDFTQQALPGQQTAAQHDQYPDNFSDGSADMSIEIGRGVKRGARDRDQDISEQNIVFSMGGDSLYELTGTPPLPGQKVRGSQQKKGEDGGLRRQASIQAAKRTASSKPARSLSEALHKARVEGEDDSFVAEDPGNTATFNARNTRFARSRQTSAALPQQQQTPRRNQATNGTVQSNSFMLPDLPNITELVSGTRKDGTPLFAKTSKPTVQSRSRFTSGSYPSKPLKPEHMPIESVPVPDDEKAIYASLQLLRDRVAQLEFEKSEASKRAEEYETDIIELRAQLSTAQKRPDSGLGSSAGSDDEVAGGCASKGNARLQANVKSLEGQLGRSERKTSVAEISLQRVTKERDELITQIGVAYYNNEELKVENDAVKTQVAQFGAENEELKTEIDALRQENQDLRVLMAQTRASYEDDATRRSAQQTRQQQKKTSTAATGLSEREIREAARLVLEQTPRRSSQGREKIRSKRNAVSDQTGQTTYGSHGFVENVDEDDSGDLAVRIAQEVKRNREAAISTSQATADRRARTASQNAATSTGARQRSRSKSQTRPASAPKRATASEVRDDVSDAESTTQLDFIRNPKRASLSTAAAPARGKPAAREEDTRDITTLSDFDEPRLYDLRKRIEEEHRARRLGGARASSAPSGTAADNVAPIMSGGLGRKSSMKDVTTGSEKRDETVNSAYGLDESAKVGKSVRVQSPHSSFDTQPPQQHTHNLDQLTGDLSISSNTSRRRRRAVSAEGMTSAFILPDITLSGKNAHINPAHNKDNCTACPPGPKDIVIPKAVPVTDRPEDIPADVTSATIRPSQPPRQALDELIKQFEDEVAHLKIQQAIEQRRYAQHDPSLSKKRRIEVKAKIDKLGAEIERRSDQVYSLYDVLEAHKHATTELDVDETLESLGIDPAEISGRVGRSAPGADVGGAFAMDGMSEASEDLPFEGFSDGGETDEEILRKMRRRSGEF